jgi:hypothetical protein
MCSTRAGLSGAYFGFAAGRANGRRSAIVDDAASARRQ